MRRRGVTLLELLIVLTIIGLIVGVSGLAWTTVQLPRETARVRQLRTARAEAIRTGTVVRVTVDSSRESVAFLPDGRALGPGVDPLTGAPGRDAKR